MVDVSQRNGSQLTCARPYTEAQRRKKITDWERKRRQITKCMAEEQGVPSTIHEDQFPAAQLVL